MRAKDQMAFQMIPVLCGAPGMLHNERQTFLDVVGQVNEAEGLAHSVLFVPLSLGTKTHPQEIIDQNIRDCWLYVLLLEDTFGGNTFLYDYRYAKQCCADPDLPMKEVVVLFKKLGPLRDMEPKVEEFRKMLETSGASRYFDFDGPEQLQARLQALLTPWLREIIGQKAVSA